MTDDLILTFLSLGKCYCLTWSLYIVHALCSTGEVIYVI